MPQPSINKACGTSYSFKLSKTGTYKITVFFYFSIADMPIQLDKSFLLTQRIFPAFPAV